MDIVGELAASSPVGSHDEDVFLPPDRTIRQPETIGGHILFIFFPGVLCDRDGFTVNTAGRGIEGHFPDVALAHPGDIRDLPAVFGSAGIPGGRRRTGRHRLGRTQDVSGFLTEGNAPQVHAASPVAAEVEIPTVRRPDGTPVHMSILCDGNRLASRGRQGPDVSLTGPPPGGVFDRPVGNPLAVRRPARLHRVAFDDEAPLAAVDINRPELALGQPPFRPGASHAFGCDDNFTSVGRPGRLEAEVGQPSNRLASRTHQEDPTAIPFRSKRYLTPIG